MNLPSSIYQTWSALFFPPANFYICDVLFSNGSFDTFQDLQFKAKVLSFCLLLLGSMSVKEERKKEALQDSVLSCEKLSTPQLHEQLEAIIHCVSISLSHGCVEIFPTVPFSVASFH